MVESKGVIKIHYYGNLYVYYPVYYPNPYYNQEHRCQYSSKQPRFDRKLLLKDYGPKPFIINIEEAAEQNTNFRTTLWTGKHLQLTLMNLNIGEDIGFEIHPFLDQFIRIEEGRGIVQMGDSKDHLELQERVDDDDIIIIPAGKWHNLINTGQKPLKLYSIYAPPQHPFGTVHKTKAEDMHN